jgi:hypothetical protein
LTRFHRGSLIGAVAGCIETCSLRGWTRFCRGPQGSAQKRKPMTLCGFLFQWDSWMGRFGSRAMIEAARMNAILVALLMTASAVNGLIFYAYL